MWRRYGDAAYTLMTLAIFGFETIALGALSLSFLLGSASGIASTPVEGILLGIVISTASALALLGLYLLSYHFISNMRDRWQADRSTSGPSGGSGSPSPVPTTRASTRATGGGCPGWPCTRCSASWKRSRARRATD